VDDEAAPRQSGVFSPLAFAADLGHSHSTEKVVDMKCNQSVELKKAEYQKISLSKYRVS
jgi:hypothetical protein